MTRRILIIDDQASAREQLRRVLEADSYEVEAVSDGRAALERLGERDFHAVVAELRAPGICGLDLLARIRARRPSIGVVFLTAGGDPADAFNAMKAGADEVLAKPFDSDRLRRLIRRILDRRRFQHELEHLRTQMKEGGRGPLMVSKSPRMRRIFDLIEQVGPLGSTVLIGGETGTGKELVAQAIHAADSRRTGPFVAVNCAVLNESILESELFGHEKGSFTGAERLKIGRFETADGGTLLLDEIGDTPPAFQSKLLRVLQTGAFERVGGTRTVQVDVRIVAATNKRLDDEVRAGRFRADLFYRLSVIRIDLPSLRDRIEDVPLLAAHFLERHAPGIGDPIREIHPDAMEALLDYSWPGNVRELQNAISAAVALADSPVVRREDLPETIAPRLDRSGPQPSLIDVARPLPELTDDLVGRIEREYFRRLLDQYKGNVARTARHSGLSRRSVAQKLLKYGLDRRSFKKSNPTPRVTEDPRRGNGPRTGS